MSSRLPKSVFLLSAVYALAYFRHDYPLLPNIVASHFDAHGTPNGWQMKQTFLGLFAAMTLLSAFLVFGVSKIVAFMPKELINLPNKDYWLDPERRNTTIRFLDAWFAWFGCAVYAVIFTAFDFAIQTNLHAPAAANAARVWYTLLCFAAFMAVWTIRLFSRFGRLPPGPSR